MNKIKLWIFGVEENESVAFGDWLIVSTVLFVAALSLVISLNNI